MANTPFVATHTAFVKTNAPVVLTNALLVATFVPYVKTNRAFVRANGAKVATNRAKVATNGAKVTTNALFIATYGAFVRTNGAFVLIYAPFITLNASFVVANTPFVTIFASFDATFAPFALRTKPKLMIEVRECRTFEEFDACVVLQREAFGYSDLEISPRRYLILSRRAGGWTLGAFDAGQLVGFVHHLVAVRGHDEIIGYSHMMAVAQPFQNRGVGALLKWAQRERAISEGRSYITWTWNPMQTRNAHFNLNRLGVTVSSYAANFYGTERNVEETCDPTGLDSDRLFADWDLHSPRVAELAAGTLPPPPPAPAATIEIPPGWNALLRNDRAAARREQQRVRSEFQSAFAAGLLCAGFQRDPAHPRYLLYNSDE